MLTFLRSGLRWGRFWRSPESLLAEGLAQVLADLAHFLPHFPPTLPHFTSPIHLSVTEFAVPFAMRRTHFVPHLPASLRQFAPGFSARPTGFGHRGTHVLPAFPAPVRQRRHCQQQCND